jgi:hypothetical protein
LSIGIAVRKQSRVAPFAHGGELICEAPFLYVTSVGKFHHKNHQGKLWI